MKINAALTDSSDAGRVQSDTSVLEERFRYYWPIALLLTGFYVATCIYISARRLLWFDEVLTAITSRLPDVATIFRSLVENGADQTPFLPFLIARAFDQVLHSDVALRIPAALALGATFIVLFDLTRRLTNGLYGVISIAILSTSFVMYYGYEARPYALCLLMSTIALRLWLIERPESKFGNIAFGIVFFLGCAFHYYFALCIIPFVLMAMRERRFLHPKIVAGSAGIVLSLAAQYPVIAGARAKLLSGDIGALSVPTLEQLQEVYLDFFPMAVMPIVVVVVSIAFFGRGRKAEVEPMTSAERVGWLFLIIPFFGYCAGYFVTHKFSASYVIGAVPGLILAFTMAFRRYCRDLRRVTVAAAFILCGLGVALQFRTILHPERVLRVQQNRLRQTLALEEMLQREGIRHMVFGGPLGSIPYLEVWHYSKHRDLYAYVVEGMPHWSILKYTDLKFQLLSTLIADHSNTAVIDADSYTVRMLMRAGIQFRVRFTEPFYVLYLQSN